MKQRVDQGRITLLNEKPQGRGPVIYWMSRDQRMNDNWALLYAQDLALEAKQPLVVAFCLVPQFLGATLRHYRFMLEGLAELQKSLRGMNIGFILLKGNPQDEVPRLVDRLGAGAVVSDFSPLRKSMAWKAAVSRAVACAFHEVDAHNVVPCREASPKQEYAAYTFRPKIKKLLARFLTDIPGLIRHPLEPGLPLQNFDSKEAEIYLKVPDYGRSAGRFHPGEKNACHALRLFVENKLAGYGANRNNPVLDGQSGLSPYLHFGQLSAQRLAIMVKEAEAPGVQVEPFLEELIVRRELSDNFCYYNKAYDSVASFPRWAQETLAEHAEDPRDHLYSLEEFENAGTHDDLWNAAQQEMVITGKMHGYMRMYWAKKILEWSESPDQALSVAVRLNDHYSLDGRDPNGYAGIAWSIGGVHDRAWARRPIFGKIRYMSYRGSRSKFDVDRYIAKIKALQ